MFKCSGVTGAINGKSYDQVPKLFAKMGHPTSHLLSLGVHMSTKFTMFSKFTFSLMN